MQLIKGPTRSSTQVKPREHPARLASIDIGSNSVLFLLADYTQVTQKKAKLHRFQVLVDDYEVTRLSHGIQTGYAISEDALLRTIAALKKYRDKARSHDAMSVFVAGTEAIRKASNRDDVVERLQEAVEAPVHMISGDEEALYSFSSVASEIPLNERKQPLLVFDIGGASTEFYCSDYRKKLFDTSLPTGSVKISEHFLEHDPPTDNEIDTARKAIHQAFENHLKRATGFRAIGVAGTMATLSAVQQQLITYDRTKAHGCLLTEEIIHNQIESMKHMTVAERRGLTGVDPRRADVILGGALIAEHILQFFGLKHMQFFDRGIRFGHLYQRLGLVLPGAIPLVEVTP